MYDFALLDVFSYIFIQLKNITVCELWLMEASEYVKGRQVFSAFVAIMPVSVSYLFIFLFADNK